MAASISLRKKLMNKGNTQSIKMASLFCAQSRLRVGNLFAQLWKNNDHREYKLA